MAQPRIKTDISCETADAAARHVPTPGQPLTGAPPGIPRLSLAPTRVDDESIHGFPIDRLLHSSEAQATGGLSPAALTQAYADWPIRLLNEPGKQADLVRKAAHSEVAMKALDVMTSPVITIRSDASIADAIRLMLQHPISGLPVVDQAGKLVGVVTEGDFLRRSEAQTERRRSRWLQFLLGPGRLAAEYTRTHSRKVAEVMTRAPVTAEEGATMPDIVRLMEERHIKRIPIVRDGQLVGIVSRANLLQLLAHIVGEIRPASATDSNIRAAILAELQKQPWAPGISVIVCDRVVDLKGAIFDERQRSALRVAAENVPGVRDVQDHLVLMEPISATNLNPLEMDLKAQAPDR